MSHIICIHICAVTSLTWAYMHFQIHGCECLSLHVYAYMHNRTQCSSSAQMGTFRPSMRRRLARRHGVKASKRKAPAQEVSPQPPEERTREHKFRRKASKTFRQKRKAKAAKRAKAKERASAARLTDALKKYYAQNEEVQLKACMEGCFLDLSTLHKMHKAAAVESMQVFLEACMDANAVVQKIEVLQHVLLTLNEHFLLQVCPQPRSTSFKAEAKLWKTLWSYAKKQKNAEREKGA